MMIRLNNTKYDELPILSNMSQQKHISTHLNSKPLKEFQKEFLLDTIIYLSIVNIDNIIMGYVILSTEEKSVQLKRIVIDEKHLGIGQEVLREVEQYCLKKLDTNSLWLDVYADNSRAMYVYKKLRYERFKKGIENAREVLFYRKTIVKG